MLKIKKFLIVLQNFLFILLFLLTSSMFYVRYRMYNIMNNLTYLDKKIERLKSDRNLLNIELTYLSSTERLLSIIDNDPKILNNKNIIKISQFKTKEEIINISLAKARNKIYENRKIAKNKTINDLIESEL